MPGIEARLVELHAERLSYREIAEILSMEFELAIPRNAIIGKCHRIGLPYREKPRKVVPKPRVRKRSPRKRAAAEPVPPPPPRIVPIENVTLLDLTDDICHWPYGEYGALTYCGRPVFMRSYCCGHFHLAYNVPHQGRA